MQKGFCTITMSLHLQVCEHDAELQCVSRRNLQITACPTGWLNSTLASVWCVIGPDFGSLAEWNSQKPNPGQDSILAGSLVAKDLKSVLEHWGTSYTVFEAFVAASLWLSEVG
jgi:hypothetical protein